MASAWLASTRAVVLLVSSDGASLAVPSFADARPVARQVDHVAGVEHSVAEQMVELEPGAVDGPVVARLGVVEVIAFRRQHRQMLHVAPAQSRTAHTTNAPYSRPLPSLSPLQAHASLVGGTPFRILSATRRSISK